MTTNSSDSTPAPCVCCDGKGWQERNDGIRVPCPGCDARQPFWPPHPTGPRIDGVPFWEVTFPTVPQTTTALQEVYT